MSAFFDNLLAYMRQNHFHYRYRKLRALLTQQSGAKLPGRLPRKTKKLVAKTVKPEAALIGYGHVSEVASVMFHISNLLPEGESIMKIASDKASLERRLRTMAIPEYLWVKIAHATRQERRSDAAYRELAVIIYEEVLVHRILGLTEDGTWCRTAFQKVIFLKLDLALIIKRFWIHVGPMRAQGMLTADDAITSLRRIGLDPACYPLFFRDV
jgi:hypothetical protein